MSRPLESYLSVLTDERRLRAYARAIARVVRPGDVVLDLGAGLGTFAVAAALAGARRVLAVESDPIGRFALDLARANGVAPRVTLLEGRSTELSPPELADVCIFDDFTVLDLARTTSRTLADARSRWLRPDARIVPEAIELCVAPVALTRPPCEARSSPRLGPVDLASVLALGVATPWTLRVPERNLVSRPRTVHRTATGALGDAGLDTRIPCVASRATTVTGLACWLRLRLAKGIVLDTGPRHAPTAYAHTYLPLPTPLRVRAGERLWVQLRKRTRPALDGAHSILEWQVETRTRASNGSTFGAMPLPIGR